jgi:NADPH-dependent 2,4-dienoyl-CoA reductase/sulfur reductase-like enzyme
LSLAFGKARRRAVGLSFEARLVHVRVAIIGGGIGGLAAAVALRRVDIESIVLERVTEIREVGAGLSIWLNAVNAIRELGLEASVLASASIIEQNLTQTPTGRLIVRSELNRIIPRACVPVSASIARFCKNSCSTRCRPPQ